jgi:hypothetical protein
MKIIDFNYLQMNHSYYIYQLQDNKKYYGKFKKIYDYNFFYIAVFEDVSIVPYIEGPPIELYILINRYGDNIEFYIPEIECLFLKQILQQKIMDEYLAKTLALIYN